MKKQLLIIGIIVLLVCVGLSGCNEKDNVNKVTMRGLLLSASVQGNESHDYIMFFILENFTFNMFKDFWTNGSANGYDANHTFVLTRNGQLILDTETYELSNAKFDNTFHVYDEISVTGVIGTTKRINPDGEENIVPSIDIISIEKI